MCFDLFTNIRRNLQSTKIYYFLFNAYLNLPKIQKIRWRILINIKDWDTVFKWWRSKLNFILCFESKDFLVVLRNFLIKSMVYVQIANIAKWPISKPAILSSTLCMSKQRPSGTFSLNFDCVLNFHLLWNFYIQGFMTCFQAYSTFKFYQINSLVCVLMMLKTKTLSYENC